MLGVKIMSRESAQQDLALWNNRVNDEETDIPGLSNLNLCACCFSNLLSIAVTKLKFRSLVRKITFRQQIGVLHAEDHALKAGHKVACASGKMGSWKWSPKIEQKNNNSPSFSCSRIKKNETTWCQMILKMAH